MISEDIILDDNGDLLLDDGDFVTGESDMQHIEDILDAYPGEYRHAPTIGVYLQRSINGVVDERLKRDIQLNLTMDNYKVKSLSVTGEKIEIDAHRND